MNNQSNAVSHLAEDVGQKTSNVANNLLDKVDSATSTVRTFANDSAKKTQHLVERGLDGLSSIKENTQTKYNQYADNLNDKVTSNPMQSLLIAAGVGAIVALLVSRDSRRY